MYSARRIGFRPIAPVLSEGCTLSGDDTAPVARRSIFSSGAITQAPPICPLFLPHAPMPRHHAFGEVDDLDKIVDTSASGLAGGVAGMNPGGSASAGTGAALRILALLQVCSPYSRYI